MNPDDLVFLAREIYIRTVAQQPTNWDKQKMAREAIESAKQFFLALQSEREGSASQTFGQQQTNPPPGSPTASTEQSQTVYSVLKSLEERRTEGNQQASGRGMVRQRHLGQEMG